MQKKAKSVSMPESAASLGSSQTARPAATSSARMLSRSGVGFVGTLDHGGGLLSEPKSLVKGVWPSSQHSSQTTNAGTTYSERLWSCPSVGFVERSQSDLIDRYYSTRRNSSWARWKGVCMKCKKKLTDPMGEIFCANFGTKRGEFEKCKSAWCPSCYESPEELEFPRVELVDEEGLELPQVDSDMFLCARAGDTLMTPFQCEFCLFQNIHGRNHLRIRPEDRLSMKLLRRANLDAFWARTSNTVQTNLGLVRRYIKTEIELDVDTMPPRGPMPLEDTQGAGTAMVMLKRSLDRGRNARTVQFGTVRKLRSAFSNFWQASKGNEFTTVFSLENGKSWFVNTCPSNSFWFNRFIKGMHERSGDQPNINEALSCKLMSEIMMRLNKRVLNDPKDSRSIEFGCYLLFSFLAALRGNETMMISLGAILELTEKEESLTNENYIVLPLIGKFKQVTSLTVYLLFVSKVTKSDFGCDVGTWLNRLLEVRKKEGRTTGWLFSKKSGERKGEQLEMSHFEGDLHEILKEIQITTKLIPKDISVEERYSVFRSARRGATTEARNREVPDEVIELNNGWRKKERARGKSASLPMIQHYTEDKLSSKIMLKFSAAL